MLFSSAQETIDFYIRLSGNPSNENLKKNGSIPSVDPLTEMYFPHPYIITDHSNMNIISVSKYAKNLLGYSNEWTDSFS